MQIDGVNGIVRPSVKRIWRVKKAFEFLSGRPIVSGDDVLHLLGDATNLFLFRRGLLGITRNLYDFSARRGSSRARLWPGAAREARWVAALVPLAGSDLRRPWGPRVLCSDASEYGYGVVEACRSAADVERHGLFREQWRYRDSEDELLGPRELALREESDRPPEARFFPEVEREFVGPEASWAEIASGPWRREEGIFVLGARAASKALAAVVRDPSRHHSRVLFLIDNMSLVHTLDKGRCRKFEALQVARRWAALCLASDILAFPRWGASELNPADAPSRRYVGSWRCAPARVVEKDARNSGGLRDASGSPAAESVRATAGTSRAAPPFHRPAIEFAMANPPSRPMLASHGAEASVSLLERISVGQRTHIHYEIRLDTLRTFLKENGVETDTAEKVDEALVLFMTEAYLEGRPVEFGCKMLAAFQWQNPSFGRHGKLSLPRARLALQGWSKGAPPRQRLPMAWLRAAAVAAEMVRNKHWCAAVCMLLMFDLYLRPGEAFALMVQSAAPPVMEGGASTRHWAFPKRVFLGDRWKLSGRTGDVTSRCFRG